MKELVVSRATTNTMTLGKLLLAKTLKARGNCVIPKTTIYTVAAFTHVAFLICVLIVHGDRNFSS